jgi:hypothetical protein
MMVGKGENPTPKSLVRELERLQKGDKLHMVGLNDDSEHPTLGYVVDFDQVSSPPVAFLNTWVQRQHGARLRLLPPYREYVSQGYGRMFSRVALPVAIRLCSLEEAKRLLAD